MASIEDYTCARDFADAVRDAAREANRTARTIERMRGREGVRGQSFEPTTSHSKVDVNGTRATIERMDYEARMRSRMKDDYALIDLATKVLYGTDNRGGVSSLVGSSFADVVFWRCCVAETWEAVGAALGYSERQCRRMYDVTIDAIDAIGFRRCLIGWGMAED